MANYNAHVATGNKQDKNKLNDRQNAFVDYYIQSNNISDAARKAGYSPKTASGTGFELLKNPKIQAAIKARTEELTSKRTADTQEILEYLAAVMRGEVQDEVVVNVGTGKGFTRPEKVKAKVTAKDRNKAAEMLAKVHGMFIDKQKVELNGILPVVIADDL